MTSPLKDRQFLAGLNITSAGSDLVALYDVSDLSRGPVLVDTGAFSVDNANGVFGGNVVFGGNRLFALNSNNGIVAYGLPGDPPPTATIQRSEGNITIEWNGGGTRHVTDKIVGGTWTNTALTSPAIIPENMLKSVQFGRVGK